MEIRKVWNHSWICAFFASLSNFSLCMDSRMFLLNQENDRYLFEGERNISLVCEVTGVTGDIEFLIQHDDDLIYNLQQVPNEFADKFEVTSAGNYSRIITLKTVDEQTAGFYTCVVLYNTTMSLSSFFELNISAKTPRCWARGTNFFTPGDQIILECFYKDVRDILTSTWERIAPNNFTENLTSEVATLGVKRKGTAVIDSVSLDDNGVLYRCNIMTKFLKVSYSCEIGPITVVQHPFKLTTESNTQRSTPINITHTTQQVSNAAQMTRTPRTEADVPMTTNGIPSKTDQNETSIKLTEATTVLSQNIVSDQRSFSVEQFTLPGATDVTEKAENGSTDMTEEVSSKQSITSQRLPTTSQRKETPDPSVEMMNPESSRALTAGITETMWPRHKTSSELTTFVLSDEMDTSSIITGSYEAESNVWSILLYYILPPFVIIILILLILPLVCILTRRKERETSDDDRPTAAPSTGTLVSVAPCPVPNPEDSVTTDNLDSIDHHSGKHLVDEDGGRSIERVYNNPANTWVQNTHL